jgi:hypothetical protein
MVAKMKSKRLLLVLLISLIILVIGAPASAETYYVDATLGKDLYNGTTTVIQDTALEGPWKTIAKVNATSFSPGDRVLFKKGEIWREQLTIPSSGSPGKPITFGAYGLGPNPKIYRTESFGNWWEHSLIINGGMEFYNTANPIDGFGNWGGWNNTINGTIKGDTEVPHIGSACVKFYSTNTGGRWSGFRSEFWQYSKVLHGRPYYLSAWGRIGSAVNNLLFLKIQDTTNNKYLDHDGQWQDSNQTVCIDWNSANQANTWIQNTITFIPRSNAILKITFYNSGNGSSWLDDVYFIQGNAPSSARIWAGTIKGNSNYWGALRCGNRVIRYYPWPRTNPVNMADGYFNAPLNQGYFYLRQDSGYPEALEIGCRRRAIYLRGKSYVTIEGVDAYGPGGRTDPGSSTNISSIDIGEGAHDIILRNLEISHGDAVGIAADIPTSNVTYDNLKVHDNQSTGIYMDSQGGSILNCKSYNNGRLSTDVGDMGGIGIFKGGNIILSGNEVYRNGLDDKAADFEISVVGTVNPVTITKNHVHDCIQGGIQIAEGGNNSVISYNIISKFGTTSADPLAISNGAFAGIRIGGGIGGARGVKVVNNIIYGGAQAKNATHAGLYIEQDSAKLMIKNNIFLNNTCKDIYVKAGTNTTDNDIDYNIYYKTAYANNWYWKGKDYSTLTAWRTASSGDAHSLTSNPFCVNASGTYSQAADFKLKPNSPGIKAGGNVGLTKDYQGSPVPFPPGSNPNIGAFERP